MATTEADICNLGLLRIGERQVIDSLEDPTEAAKVAKVLYPLTRDSVLASMWWKFATRRAVLAEVANGARTGWSHCYALPVDCVTVQEVVGSTRNPGPEQAIPFELEDDPVSGRVLLTDHPDVELKYTTRETAVPRYPPLFVDALAWALASEFAYSIPVKPALGQAMAQQYEMALRRAAAQEFRQSQPDVPPESEFIRVR